MPADWISPTVWSCDLHYCPVWDGKWHKPDGIHKSWYCQNRLVTFLVRDPFNAVQISHLGTAKPLLSSTLTDSIIKHLFIYSKCQFCSVFFCFLVRHWHIYLDTENRASCLLYLQNLLWFIPINDSMGKISIEHATNLLSKYVSKVASDKKSEKAWEVMTPAEIWN